jgi:hypothetical protein
MPWDGVNGDPGYSDKPTGMLCIGGAIYLAFQNLNEQNFGYSPAASIVMSSNHGQTWTTPSSTPMFGAPTNTNPSVPALFTTIFFLDYGQNSANAIDGYVYAYGIDNNWQYQTAMYLARVPANQVLIRSSWSFFTGVDGNNNPSWSSDITQKRAVLTDNRKIYQSVFTPNGSSQPGCGANENVIGQGGVTYDAPLRRYLFVSWSCPTHEFYEAPEPWGPWSHFLTTDFGSARLLHDQGMYGTSIPSKYISADGKTLYVQSNVVNGQSYYDFSLRRLYLQPYTPTSASNAPSTMDLSTLPGTQATSKSTHMGTLCSLNCSDQLNSGSTNAREDDYDEESKTTDWWGYTWPQKHNFNQVVYETGNLFYDGGWYASNLTIQVRNNFVWVNVPGVTISPDYPYNSSAGAQTSYTFSFPDVVGDGLRIIGTPGGSHNFTSISRLGVYFRGGSTNLIADLGFEQQKSSTVSGPWIVDGPDAHGIDRGTGYAHSGSNNAWIRDSTTNWNATSQWITVTPNTNYYLTGWVQNNFGTNLGYLTARASNGDTVLGQATFGACPNYQQFGATFNSGANTSVKITTGFWGQGTDTWLRIDDIDVQ